METFPLNLSSVFVTISMTSYFQNLSKICHPYAKDCLEKENFGLGLMDADHHRLRVNLTHLLLKAFLIVRTFDTVSNKM